MNKNRQLFINMSASLVAYILNFGISFFLSPYLIESVGAESYGFISLSNTLISYISLITVALNSMASRFITIKLHENNLKKANAYFNSVLISNIFLSGIILIPGIVFITELEKIINIPNNIINDVKILFMLTLLTFLVSLIGNVFSVATFAKNRLELSSVRDSVLNIIKAVLLVTAFALFKPSIIFMGIASVLLAIGTVLTNMLYTKKLLPEIKLSLKEFDFSSVKEILSSGIWNSFNKLSSILSTGLDLLITNVFIGATPMGILSIAKTLPGIILGVFGMLASVFSPQLTISYAKGEYDEIKMQLLSSMKILGMVASIPMVFLFVFGKEFFLLWVPTQDAVLLQKLSVATCLGFVFSLPLEGLWNIFTVTNKIKISSIFLFINSLLSTIGVFIGLQFTANIETKLLIVAGMSTIFSIIRALTFLPIYGAKCLNMRWFTFYPQIIKNAIAVVAITGITIFLKTQFDITTWMQLIIAAGGMSIIALIFNYYLILGKSERAMFSYKIKKLLHL
ncbi:oligosaccharide flippase family protein [Tyzzerella nexilis]|nr:oligosaccharide flippase family protein [[Clostridium] nexile]MCB7557036.1 oligosaccharide flippase family protein [[Clostridium] nexile]MCC3675018.1 oligosaccharide flippase family protein [[Clostridium] nexile]NSD85247.1 oligosaccharide flippase family protein [[Clostridium] nexile]NSD87806.1 oligosaccharide flippase family protein [[Clostridium] nexile]